MVGEKSICKQQFSLELFHILVVMVPRIPLCLPLNVFETTSCGRVWSLLAIRMWGHWYFDCKEFMPSSVSLVPSAALLLSFLSVSVSVWVTGVSFARRPSPHSPSSASQTHYAIVCITSPINSITAIVIVSFCFSFEHWYFVCKESLSSRSELR